VNHEIDNFMRMAKQEVNKAYQSFLAGIKQKVHQSQYQAMRQVNSALIGLYWEIGQDIAEKQQRYKWGKSIVEKLAADLQHEFPGMQGWSVANLWRMRKFYLTYKEDAKLARLVREIGWGHNVAIFEKVKQEIVRHFYIAMCRHYGWTRDLLVHHIDTELHKKYAMNQTNFKALLPEEKQKRALLSVKDEYQFDFLELGEDYKERELELALVKNIRRFLAEMGGDFTFVANQYRVEVNGEEFFIDILLYHRKLKSLVALELKAGRFKPEYAGKMQFYLSVLDDKVKHEDENPSIGIIICRTKDRMLVEYTLRTVNSPIGVASYEVTKSLPRDMKGYLPSPKELEERLLHFIEAIQAGK
jgi:predicted nuclease of restriction endonuclease-like (RecB) superfamily